MVTRIRMLVLSIVTTSVLLIGCQSNDPQDRSIILNIQNSNLSDPSPNLVVTQDDTVSLIMTSDKVVKLHLHGYDLERQIAPGTTETLKFQAAATGSFPITIHTFSNGKKHGDDHHDEQKHGDLFESPVLQSGDSFKYEVVSNSIEQTIHYHSHLHPELEGSIIVSSHGPIADEISITISDTSVDPTGITVKPGTQITWIHKDSVPHIIVSGRHPKSSMGIENSKSSHHDDRSADDPHELELGRLEVHPR